MSAVTMDMTVVVTLKNLAICWKLWICLLFNWQIKKCYLLLISRRRESDNIDTQTISRKGFYRKNFSMEQWLKEIDPKDGYYIAGFTDGEGSFNVSIKKRNDYAEEWKITASFNISQKDRVILAWIKNILGCGSLRERKDGVVYYEVTNIASLKEKIIPFFVRFNFISARKKANFSIFKKIVEKMHSKDHLSPEGLKSILELREILNEGKGRKRKYNLSDVIKIEESPETIRKTVSNQLDVDDLKTMI